MTAPDLLPCPHCRGAAEVIRPASGSRPYVMCVSQYCTAPKPTEAEAIAAWNTRATPAAMTPEVQALVEAAERARAYFHGGEMDRPFAIERQLKDALAALRAGGDA